MTPKDRIIATLNHEKPDRVPTGENEIDYELVEQLLGHLAARQAVRNMATIQFASTINSVFPEGSLAGGLQ